MATINLHGAIIDEIVSGVLDILNNDVVSIILYGSVARGTETPESDVDIAIIIKNTLNREKRNALNDFFSELDLKYDKLFSAIDIDDSKFQTWKNVIPFYQNVSKEGIVLWKAA